MEYLSFNRNFDRRVFIKGLGYVSMGLVLSTLGGCEALLEKIENRPVRRRLRTGSPEVDDAIAVYEDAVSQMKALPASNPRSWDFQAGLHGTVVPNVFNFCQHGTDHFFSWHRAYLFYFESICQTLTGEDSFGLPYWNWNQDSAMHSAFTDASSPLFHPRNNTSVSGAAFSDMTMDIIFSDANFFTFGSQIEGSPHNTAHVQVGADMVTGGSSQDPVFWAHHCMVDYCWAKWNIELENDNTNDAGWNDTSWSHFVDGNGDPVTVTAGSTAIMPLLSYQYESSAIGSAGARAALSVAELREIEKRVKQGADVRFDVKQRIPIVDQARVLVSRPFSTETRVSPADFSALLESDKATERIFARINYAKLPPTNDFFVRVFINLPTATTATPTDDPHFAGTFAFFGVDAGNHRKHHHKTDFLVNVTDTLQRLQRAGEMRATSPVSVQLVAVPVGQQFARADAELVLENVELIISPVQIRSR